MPAEKHIQIIAKSSSNRRKANYIYLLLNDIKVCSFCRKPPEQYTEST